MRLTSHLPLLVTAVLIAQGAGRAQDGGSFFSKFQVHGNLAQGFLFSSQNNYLTANSSDGSAKWTEGTLSVSRPITEALRVGVQVHSYSLGQMGRQRVTLDWAYADYKPRHYFGIRVGKVKTPTGLYNELQDIDAVLPWVLLPQGIYPIDMRGFLLSHLGGTVYGESGSSKRFGSIAVQAFGGQRSQPRTEGLGMSMAAQGVRLADCSGPVEGADVRWHLPVNGLLLGATYTYSNVSAPDSKAGPYPFPIRVRYQVEQAYGQFEKGPLTLSAEWRVYPTWLTLGAPERYSPMRAWYAMGSYHVTAKLTAGTYYQRSLGFLYGGRDRNSPINYQNDLALNTRFDFNRFVYLKLEGHAMHGNLFGFYPQDNPAGYQDGTRLLAARLGFAF